MNLWQSWSRAKKDQFAKGETHFPGKEEEFLVDSACDGRGEQGSGTHSGVAGVGCWIPKSLLARHHLSKVPHLLTPVQVLGAGVSDWRGDGRHTYSPVWFPLCLYSLSGACLVFLPVLWDPLPWVGAQANASYTYKAPASEGDTSFLLL